MTGPKPLSVLVLVLERDIVVVSVSVSIELEYWKNNISYLSSSVLQTLLANYLIFYNRMLQQSDVLLFLPFTTCLFRKKLRFYVGELDRVPRGKNSTLLVLL